MAEIPKHARYARQADFDERLAGGLIDDGTICFIEDTRQIWHHGNYYIEASGGGGDYLPLSGGTLTGDLVVGGITLRASDGHIVFPSGVEIY